MLLDTLAASLKENLSTRKARTLGRGVIRTEDGAGKGTNRVGQDF